MTTLPHVLHASPHKKLASDNHAIPALGKVCQNDNMVIIAYNQPTPER